MVSGLVVDATNTNVGISDAYLYVPAGGVSGRQGGVLAETHSGTDGSYTLSGFSATYFSITVDPPGSNYQGVSLEITLETPSAIQINITLLPTNLVPTQVNVEPPSATLTLDQTLDFDISTDVTGTVAPTWMVVGQIGTITPDGLFRATRLGVGTVVATLGPNLRAGAPVVVNPVGVQPPVVQASGAPTSGVVPLTVDFTGSATDGTIASYRWAFGDGSPWTTLQNPSHQYTKPGVFTALFYATNSEGASSFTTVPITVRQSRIAYQQIPVNSAPGQPHIRVIGSDGAGAVNVTDGSQFEDAEPAMSPDGTRIAFTRQVGGAWEVFAVNIDGTDLRRLTTDGRTARTPAWSPDGQRIAFASDRGADYVTHIWVINDDGSNPQQITSGTSDEYSPSWAPDGHHLAFARSEPEIPDAPLAVDIFVLDLDDLGAAPVQITNRAGHDDAPAFSPDGEWIAFQSNRDAPPGEPWEIQAYVVRSDGTGQVTRLSPQGVRSYHPSWQLPSGGRLVVSDSENLFTVAPDGTEWRQLTYDGWDLNRIDNYPSWGPPVP